MTSIPASCNARATYLAPRSCPSRPGLAMRMRNRRAFFSLMFERPRVSDGDIGAILAELGAQHVADLAQGRAAIDGLDDGWHQVVLAARGGAHRGQGRRRSGLRAPGPERLQA